MKFIFLMIFILGCSDSVSPLQYNCHALSESYKNNIQNQTTDDQKINTWEQLKTTHKNIIKTLIKDWPQNPQDIKEFSEFFYSLLNSHVQIACGEEPLPSTPFMEVKQIKEGVLKKTPIEIDTSFGYCLTKQWLAQAHLTAKSCRAFLKK